MLRAGELNESDTQATNRIGVSLSNVGNDWSINLASELRLLELADVVVRRYFRDGDNPLIFQHKYYFGGKIVNADADEKQINLEIIRKTTAAGTTISTRTCSPLCAWIFRDHNCRYLGSNLSCNKIRKSRGGCTGNLNLAHNGGWASPDNPTQSVPGTGGNGLPGIGNQHCFALDSKIWLPAGEVFIGELPLGKPTTRIPLVSFDKMTGAIDYDDEIAEVYERTVKGIYTLRFEHATVRVTSEEPFFTKWNRFTKAENLRLKDTTKAFIEGWFDSKFVGFHCDFEKETVVRNIRGKKNNTLIVNRLGFHNKGQNETEILT